MDDWHIFWSVAIAVISVVLGGALIIAGAGFATTVTGIILLSAGPYHWWVAGQMDELTQRRKLDKAK